MKEVIKVFNELIETTLTNSSNNEAVITNVKLWAESWQKEMELAINYSQCSTQLKSEDVISFEEWKQKFVKETTIDNVYDIRGSYFFGEELATQYNYDVELYNSLIV